jgi:DNA-directed RNA polymerase specialized sigma24 family protein
MARRSADGSAEISSLLDELARTRDAWRRVAITTELVERLRLIEASVSEARDAAIAQLHARGASFGEIAAVANITRARVAQLLSRVRADA